MIKKSVMSMFLMLLVLTGVSYAQEAEQGAEHTHHGPPQAAIDACSGKAEGDSCEFTTRRGKDISGTCATMDEKLVCKRSSSS